MSEIRTILTHVGPHLDELFAIWLFHRFGGERYQVVQTYRVTVCPTRVSITTEEEISHLADGILYIGVGGGRFDDHQNGQKRSTCAAELVFRELRLDGNKALARILQLVKENDLRGVGMFGDLADVVRASREMYPPQVIWIWAKFAFDILYQREEIFQAALASVEADAKAITVPTKSGVRTFVMVRSESAQVARAVRSSLARLLPPGCVMDLLVVLRNSGHVAILRENDSLPEVVLQDLIKALRAEEQKFTGAKVVWEWEKLTLPGILPEVPSWYYDPASGHILNGSASAPAVPSTKIPVETLFRCICLALSQKVPDFCTAETCGKGKCAVYAFGLSACKTKRWGERRRERKAT